MAEIGKIGKPNNLKVFGNNKTEGPKQYIAKHLFCLIFFCSIKIGYLMHANGDTHSVSDIDLKLWEVTGEDQPKNNYTFNFYAGEIIVFFCMKVKMSSIFNYSYVAMFFQPLNLLCIF